MRLPWPHRRDTDAVDPDPPLPSEDSTQRLAGQLQREIEDLRAELADDLLLTLLLLGEDEVDEAVGILDDGSDRLHRFQDRVEDAVADAAVEREAEAVVTAAAIDREPAQATRGSAFRIRVLASAAAAVLAAIVTLISVEPSDSPSLVAARSTSPTTADASPAPLTDAPSSRRAPEDGASAAATTTSTAATPEDRLEVLRIIGDQGDVLARLGSEPRRSVVAALFGVDRLIGQVVAEASEVLPTETLEAVSESLPEVQPPIEDEPTAPQEQPDDPAEEPADEPAEEPTAPSEEPSDAPTEEPSPEDAEDSEDDATSDGTADASEEPSDQSSTGTDSVVPEAGSATVTEGSGLL